MPLIVLWLAALVFGAFGVLFLVDPAGWARKVDLGVTTPTARTEIRAMYGGLELGIAAFLAWCAVEPDRLRVGLFAAGCLFAGVALGRGISLATDTGSRSIMYSLVTVEAIAAVVAFAALRFADRS